MKCLIKKYIIFAVLFLLMMPISVKAASNQEYKEDSNSENSYKFSDVDDMTDEDLEELYNNYLNQSVIIQNHKSSLQGNIDFNQNASKEVQAFIDYAYESKTVANNPANTSKLTKSFLRIQFKVVANEGEKRGYKTAAICLRHSLQDDPKLLSFENSTPISRQVKNCPEMKKKIEKAKRELKSVRGRSYFSSGSLALEINKDLYLAFHKVDYTITAEKRGAKWKMNIVVTDKYDFEVTPWKKSMSKSQKMVYALNNYAVVAQSMGAINNYNIIVRTSFMV